jgi:hypothetical protein
MCQRRDAKQKEHAEITFRDYLGETVLVIIGNYFGETVRDILKDDLKDNFRRGFKGETLWSL